MSKGTDKIKSLLNNLKKLSPDRKAYWLSKLKTLSVATQELGSDSGKLANSSGERDWLLDLANTLDRYYQKATQGALNTIDESTLRLANNVDKIYKVISDEAVKIPAKIGSSTGQMLGSLTASNYAPYLIGGAVVLGAVYYMQKLR